MFKSVKIGTVGMYKGKLSLYKFYFGLLKSDFTQEEISFDLPLCGFIIRMNRNPNTHELKKTRKT